MEGQWMSCCFTGYRPHRFRFSPDGLRPEHIEQTLYDQIGRLYKEGCRTFISGMCTGVDLWAAAAVVRWQDTGHPDVRLIGAVPFEGQESKWSSSERQTYRRLLEHCAETVILCTPDEVKSGASQCYRKRNRWMVDHANTLIAVYDPTNGTRRSGTAATVNYARSQSRRIICIHPETLEITEETAPQLGFF